MNYQPKPEFAKTSPSLRFWMFAMALVVGILYAFIFRPVDARTTKEGQPILVILFCGRVACGIPKTEYLSSRYLAQALFMILGAVTGFVLAWWRVLFRVHRWMLIVLGIVYGALMGSLASSYFDTGYPASGIMAGAITLAVFFYYLPDGISADDAAIASGE